VRGLALTGIRERVIKLRWFKLMVERTVTIPPRRRAKKTPLFLYKGGECI